MKLPTMTENMFSAGLLDNLVAELSPFCRRKQRGNLAIRGLFGDPGVEWIYESGNVLPSNPWQPLSLEIKNTVSDKFNCNFNSATGYVYQDGGEVHAHSDFRFIKNIISDCVIVCSFGAPRTIQFIDDANTITEEIILRDGSALVIPKEYDECHLHRVVDQPGLRVSLTFRQLAKNE